MLSPEAIAKFKSLYKKLYGEEIDDAVAKDRGTRLINFIKIVLDMENAVKNYKKESEVRKNAKSNI